MRVCSMIIGATALVLTSGCTLSGFGPGIDGYYTPSFKEGFHRADFSSYQDTTVKKSKERQDTVSGTNTYGCVTHNHYRVHPETGGDQVQELICEDSVMVTIFKDGEIVAGPNVIEN